METEKALKILMLEDSPEDVELIERILRKDQLHFVRDVVDTREQFMEAIRIFKPDVVLSDHGLPGFNSREALKICLREKSNTPFILVTGSVTDDYAISCIRDGADDYILKSNLQRLPVAIRSAVKKRKLEKLKREARFALRKQNDELLKVNKELDSFVYSVSHNLRGPLASILGLLNIAQQEIDTNAMHEVHNMMARSIHKLDETLAEILEYSKNARNDVHLGEVDWLSLIHNSLHKLEYLDPGGLVDREIVLKTDQPFYSDGNRITTILTNILSNAILYRTTTRTAKVYIEVTTTIQQAVIIVRDNGIGIAEEVLPKVYSMFYRGTDSSQGAGLGLYIVREIVSKLRGSMGITSTLGKGTTVTIVLPNQPVKQ
jgi:signal transduction histidine kinase